MMALLEVRGLTKNFGGLAAVSELDFDVNEGEILGIIGPNGAGKSTIFNMICGRFQPTSGTLTFQEEEYNRAATSPNSQKRDNATLSGECSFSPTPR